jgi:ABC-2 type transport system permease protein
MFTDVPHVKSRARRRKWLDPVFQMIPYGQNKVYTHLFSRTIARTKEYSGLIIRLTFIPAIVLVFVENPFAIIAVALFFSYLTGFQLLPLYSRHNAMVWVHLYPVSHEVKKRAFVNLLFYILAGQAVLFILILLLKGSFLNAVYAGAAGLAFAAWFSGQYAPKRIGNANE